MKSRNPGFRIDLRRAPEGGVKFRSHFREHELSTHNGCSFRAVIFGTGKWAQFWEPFFPGALLIHRADPQTQIKPQPKPPSRKPITHPDQQHGASGRAYALTAPLDSYDQGAGELQVGNLAYLLLPRTRGARSESFLLRHLGESNTSLVQFTLTTGHTAVNYDGGSKS